MMVSTPQPSHKAQQVPATMVSLPQPSLNAQQEPALCPRVQIIKQELSK